MRKEPEMKKAKNLLLYLVCFATIGYLMICAGTMGHSIVVRSADAFYGAALWMHRAANWYRNILFASAAAWLVLRYLENPVHSRDLSGYVLMLLVATALWFAYRIWYHYYDMRYNVVHHPIPWHFAVFIDSLFFVPVLILEMAAFFFLRHRGKQNYPEEYRKKQLIPKKSAFRFRPAAAVFLAVVILLSLLTCWCYTQYGFRTELTVAILDYKLSEDGKSITVLVGTAASAFNVNEMEQSVDETDRSVLLRFSTNHSPYFNLFRDQDNIFEVELPPECTQIRVYDPQFCSYDLVMKLDEESNQWLVRRWNAETEEYYFVHKEYFSE